LTHRSSAGADRIATHHDGGNMADELVDRAAIATLLLDASAALEDIARRVSRGREGAQEMSADIALWARRLGAGADGAMDRLLT
jgi:hypothetical protein